MIFDFTLPAPRRVSYLRIGWLFVKRVNWSCARYLLFKLRLLRVHNFIRLGIGIACCIQLLTISALTGRFNCSFVSRCRRSSAFTKSVSVGTGALVNPTDSVTIKPAFSALESLVPVPVISVAQQVPSLGGINSVSRCPVAPVVARGRAVSRAVAVAVELFASVR